MQENGDPKAVKKTKQNLAYGKSNITGRENWTLSDWHNASRNIISI